MSKNTSIKHRHSARTTIIWFLFILVIALTALVIYLFFHQNIEKQSKQDTNNPSQQVQSTSASTSENQSSKNEPIIKRSWHLYSLSNLSQRTEN